MTKHNGPGTAANVGVRLEGINISFGNTDVIQEVSLEIKPGEFFAFLGPSGCGKSTLLRLISGFVMARTGRVFIGDRDVSNLPPWRRNVGMVFQNYALWPHMTVRKNVAFGLEEKKVARGAIHSRVNAALELVMQAADVAHMLQQWQVYQKWNRRSYMESTRAYNAGRKLSPTEEPDDLSRPRAVS